MTAFIKGTPYLIGAESMITIAAAGSTLSLDASTASVFDVTLTADCAITLSGATAGVPAAATIILRQDSSGSRVPSFALTVHFSGGLVPVWSTGVGKTDIVTVFSVDGAATWFAAVMGIDLR